MKFHQCRAAGGGDSHRARSIDFCQRRAAGGIDVSGLPVPAFGADAAPDADGLSAALMCSTYAVQLDELISWVEAQAAVNVNEERK